MLFQVLLLENKINSLFTLTNQIKYILNNHITLLSNNYTHLEYPPKALYFRDCRLKTSGIEQVPAVFVRCLLKRFLFFNSIIL